MNRLKLKVLAVATIFVSIYSCSPADKKVGSPDSTKILNSPPFSGITDSISKFPDKAELHLRRAILLSQSNFHEIATADYKKAWNLTGDEGVALAYASNLIMTSQVNEAIKLLKEEAQRSPDNTEFSRRLGELYMQTGDNQKALNEYNNIIAKDSSNFEAWYDKGNLLLRLKDTSGSINSLETSFSLLPINYSGIALANIYVARKNPRALEILNILLSKDSAGIQTDPVFMKGVYYSEMKDYDNALKQFDECIKRDWKMTDAYIEKGIILFERKQYDEALKVFNMAATVSNTDADAYYWMGRCYEATGKKEEAIINYERALALDKNFSEAKDALRRLNS